ncbi:MAG: hypothetical protein BGP05_22495 [Rhizobiales bacterium 62-47]|nr:TadE/TadG family protein [Hyphomicrobiales bacterium]OJY10427.1 MAG: hypothetical protein BGP05_22495 [Rhizobiales bacterium 62-47]
MFGKSFLVSLRRTALQFAGDKQGNIAMLFAIALVPMLAMVGAAVDYSRANAARTSIQSALDTTALMISKDAAANPNLSPDDIQGLAKKYFAALYHNKDAPNVTVAATFAANSGSVGSTVSVTGYGTMRTDFMKVVNIPEIEINTSSKTAWGNARMRVAMVLDNTGSMADDGKMPAMQTAAKNLIDQLSKLSKTPGDMYISIIPFAKDVNVDPANYNAPWIRWTEWEAEPSILDTTKVIPGTSSTKGTKPSNWMTITGGSTCPFTNSSHGFVCMDRPATISGATKTSTIPSSGTYAGYICPGLDSGNKVSLKASIYYNGCYTTKAPVTVASGSGASCGSTANCTCSGSGKSKVCTQTFAPIWREANTPAATARTTWKGCVTDRDQNYDTLNTTPIVNDTATPSTLFYAEQWASCSTSLVPMSYDWTALKSKIDAMTPNGNTNQSIGLAWGWESLTSGIPLSTPAKDSNYTYRDAIILLSDGLNTQNRTSLTASVIDARQKIMCDNLKAIIDPKTKDPQYTIYTIQVNTGKPADATSTVLKNCASSSDKFYMLTSASQVVSAFDSIGTSLSKLRLAQ